MRKLYIVFFVIVAFVSLNFAGNASDSPKIMDINESAWQETKYSAYTANGEKITDLSQLSLLTGDKLLIPLPKEAFLDNMGLIYNYQYITPELLQESGIDVKLRAEAGNQVFDKVQFLMHENSIFIEISFVKDFAFTKEMRFDYTVYLTVDGKKQTAAEIRLEGQISNIIIQVEDSDYVDISGGEVAEALAYIKSVEVNLGNGVKTYSSFYEGFRYYGMAKVETGDNEIPLLENYPEIALIYTLRTIGLKQEGIDIVFFDLPKKYYVYNKSGDYLGTTDRKLPYSSVYYLSLTDIGNIEFPDY